MKILLNDKMQLTDAPDQVKSPALSDIYKTSNTFDIEFDNDELINCIGIGYTDASEVYIYAGSEYPETVYITQEYPFYNGLYLLDNALTDDQFTIEHNGNFIGRVGMGEYRTLNTNPTKEHGFYTTTESRTTLSGQVIPGAGGFFGRRVNLDVRYEITESIYNDIYDAYESQIMKMYPYFLLLDDEQHKLPDTMLHFYAKTDKPLSMLQSSTYKFLYSYKFNFQESF